MSFKRQNDSIFIVLIIFLFFVAYYYINKKYKNDNLIRNYKLTSGTIYGFSKDGRGQSIAVNYFYIVDGTKYNNLQGVDRFFLKKYSWFANKQFPVAYDSINKQNSKILILPSDFNKLDIEFPDSLSWILQYIEKD